MKRKFFFVSTLCWAGLFWSMACVLPGCDSGGSDTATLKPSAEQQAALDTANKATAEAHKADHANKTRR